MTGLPFNRVPRRFSEDLSRDDYRAAVEELHEIARQFREAGLPLRVDELRDWEHSHVLLEVERLSSARDPAGEPMHVLDVGGANAPLAYVLAGRGLDVTVLDVDRRAVEATRRHAKRLGLANTLEAVASSSDSWPFEAATFDLLLSVSVIEGVLRSRRAAFFSEVRRVLRSGGSLLMTFDYGVGARRVSDPPTSESEVQRDLVEASGLELVGPPFEVPVWEPDEGPPVKCIVPAVNGLDVEVAEYGFGALHLRRPE